MGDTTRLITARELEAMPDDDWRYELVRGRLIRMSPVGWLHGRVAVRFAGLLDAHVRRARLGAVVVEVGFQLMSEPDTVRGPDVAFVRQERVPSPEPRGFWQGTPDLAVEVLSSEDRPREIRTKIDEYLASGVALVLVIDPNRMAVAAHRPGTPALTLTVDETLDLTDVVPGFECRVGDLFE